MKKLLWVGDAACPSGFAKVTHGVLDTLHKEYQVMVLGINHHGDEHPYPYPIYTCFPGGDGMGVGRLVWMCDHFYPDVIVIQNDPWNFPYYFKKLQEVPEYASIPIVGSIAVDGQNCDGGALKDLTHAIFWTQFALDEARAGGYSGPATVIPLGVDLEIFHPMDKYDARARLLPKQFDDVFIVGNVNRNQPRKRWDLSVKYFAEWIRSKNVKNAYLYLHAAPTGDRGVDIRKLASYYGVLDKMILHEPNAFYGLSEEQVCTTYNCFDLQMTTTQGEGFGLPALEGMACGVPQIVPRWSGLGDWAEGAAWLVPCSSTAVGMPYTGVIGGVPDEELFIRALNFLYESEAARANNREAALERAAEERFRWPTIGAAWGRVIEEVLQPKVVTTSIRPALARQGATA